MWFIAFFNCNFTPAHYLIEGVHKPVPYSIRDPLGDCTTNNSMLDPSLYPTVHEGLCLGLGKPAGTSGMYPQKLTAPK